MKKGLLFCFLALCVVSGSFAQIYRGEAEGKEGTAPFSVHFIEYADYRYFFYINGISIFMNEDTIARLKAVLEKYNAWETLAAGEISLTKTIDAVTFTGFHYNNTFFNEPLVFYFVFTGGPLERSGTAKAAGGAVLPEGGAVPPAGGAVSGGAPAAWYTLFVDTNIDAISPFRLSSKTVQELLDALSPENLTEARNAYERQRALEDLFN